MGEVEKRIKISNIKKTVLDILTVAGALPFAVIAPQLIGVMKKLGIDKHLTPKQSYSFYRSLLRLEKDGLVKRDRNKKDFFVITEKGKKYIEPTKFQKKKMRWDGKWRILAFDIPENKRLIRSKVRLFLSEIGFMKLQDSVWIYPYNCEDVVTLIKADLMIGKEMIYMVVEEIEGDRILKQAFSLNN